MATLRHSSAGEWRFFTHVQSRHSSAIYTVERHTETLAFRCDCKGFIFSKAPKGCIHTSAADREAHEELLQEQAPSMPESVEAEALALVDRMLSAAGILVREPARRAAMAKILEVRLANGPDLRTQAQAGEARGRRMITLD